VMLRESRSRQRAHGAVIPFTIPAGYPSILAAQLKAGFTPQFSCGENRTAQCPERELLGTDGAAPGAEQAFWPPDSTFIGFVAQNSLKKVSITGGPRCRPEKQRAWSDGVAAGKTMR
jgi:hypothetical protein